ncbi:hypothetical protein AWB67_06683 [Caballeronia terrestris]|uniref:Uncharacterized protein n=1 Tax=Caballeronia terrestris TaxID=1226301 RepID=A0A158KUP8_9BURK|nr:hypothetical protein AWB67_06683 [Caballeronia terrestris]
MPCGKYENTETIPNSPMIRTHVTMPPVAISRAAIGKVTYQNVCKGEHPRSCAASSTSLVTPSNAVRAAVTK